MVDYEILDDVPHYGQNDKTVERRYTCAGLGLFYVQGSGHIVPIAIQFHQVPSDTNPIWTPNDSELDWIYAKMWLRNADTQWHQVCSQALLSFWWLRGRGGEHLTKSYSCFEKGCPTKLYARVKRDHRSKFSNLSNWKEEAWKKSGLQRDSNPWPRSQCVAS